MKAPLRTDLHRFSTVAMDTWITVQVVADASREAVEPAARRALAWFDMVEKVCSRFDPESEVMQLLGHPRQAVQVSTLLLELTNFALELAELTDGAFDPTVGAALEQRGFNQHYRTGRTVDSGARTLGRGGFRHVRLQHRQAQPWPLMDRIPGP